MLREIKIGMALVKAKNRLANRLSVAFEIVERLQAIEAFVEGFAGGAAKLAYHFGVIAPAMRANDLIGFAKQGIHSDRFILRWRYAVLPQFFLAVFAHPVCCPGRRKHQFDIRFNAVFGHNRPDLGFYHVHGRTTAVGRGDVYSVPAFRIVHFPDYA